MGRVVISKPSRSFLPPNVSTFRPINSADKLAGRSPSLLRPNNSQLVDRGPAKSYLCRVRLRVRPQPPPLAFSPSILRRGGRFMRSIRLSLLEVRSRRSPRPIITPFPGFPHPSAGQSPRPPSLLPLPLCVCKRTRPGRETKTRRDTRGRGKSVPWRPARGGWGGISIRSVSLPGWGGEVEGEVDDRRDPPRQIEINFTRITRRVACIYIHIYVFRFARILLSSLSLSSSPFIACCFRRLILGSIRFESEVEGGRIRVEGKWAWRGVGRSAVVVGLSGKIYLLGDLTKVVFVICIDLYLCARGLLGIYNIGRGNGNN